MPRRSQPAPLPPGVAKVRLSGDTVAADVLTAILRAHPAVEILTGPDKYDDGRAYLTLRVRLDGGLGRAAPGDDLLRVLHPDAEDVPPVRDKSHHAGDCWCGELHLDASVAALYDAPRLLPPPCDRYEQDGNQRQRGVVQASPAALGGVSRVA